jgi:hypothetical protein
MLTFNAPDAIINELKKDPYIAKKYNRTVRLKEKQDYIERLAPEIAKGGLSIVDIGPGPGEFLELCRHYDNKILGIDSPVENAMGAEYEKLSRVCHEYQDLPVKYYGLDGFLDDDSSSGYDLINLQGSLEMAMEPCLVGKDFHKHHNVRDMILNISLGREYLLKLFKSFVLKLNKNGRVILYCNQVRNQNEYADLIDFCSDGLTTEIADRKKTLWTFRKS